MNTRIEGMAFRETRSTYKQEAFSGISGHPTKANNRDEQEYDGVW